VDEFKRFLRKLRRSTPFKVATLLLVPIALTANLSTIAANVRVLKSERYCRTSETGSLESRRTREPKQKTGSPAAKSRELPVNGED